MAETSHEIRRQIADTRNRLGITIAALENKIDPRRIVDEHPVVLVGVAFGTGLMIATTGATSRAAHEVREQLQTGAHSINNRAGTALDGIFNAVIAAASSAITSKLGEAVEAVLHGPRASTGARGSMDATSRAA